jgi:hypothetical protein
MACWSGVSESTRTAYFDGATSMKIAVLHANKRPYAMDERIELLRATGLVEQVIAGNERGSIRSLRAGVVPYLVDVNAWTVKFAIECFRKGRPWIIDTGDDPRSLARNLGSPRWRSTAYDLANRFVVARAAGVICRGQFHQPMLSSMTNGPVQVSPDTVADEILDREIAEGDPLIVGTFGSVATPRQGDRAYGWEVIDVVASYGGGLTGIIVANGPGRSILEARAKRFGVANHVHVLEGRKMKELIEVLLPIGFVTSIQSNDLAGWVRTTGKLPLSLGLRKYLIASAVGEAVIALPPEALVRASGDQEVAGAIASVISRGMPEHWEMDARSRAEPFRRSRVARDLKAFLNGISI